MKLSILNKKIIINRTFNTQTKVLSCSYWWCGLMINGEKVAAPPSSNSDLSFVPRKIINLLSPSQAKNPISPSGSPKKIPPSKKYILFSYLYGSLTLMEYFISFWEMYFQP